MKQIPLQFQRSFFSLSKQEDCGVENLTFVSKKDGNFVVAVSKSQKIQARRIRFCSCFHQTKDFHWRVLSGGSWCRQELEKAKDGVEKVINMDTLTRLGEPKFIISHNQQKETPTVDLENNHLETPAEDTTSQTITQQPNDTETSQTLSPQPLTVQKMVQELILLNKTAFEPVANDMHGGKRNPGASRQAKSVAVKRIVNSVLDNNLTKEQQVWALRTAMKHKDMVVHSASAGLVLESHSYHHIPWILIDTLCFMPSTLQEFLSALAAGTAVAVSDGSYRKDVQRGSSAFIFCPFPSHQCSCHPMVGHNLTTGLATAQLSYRSKLTGINGILSVLDILCRSHPGLTGGLMIALDGDGALQQSPSTTTLDVHQLCCDYLQDTRERIQQLPLEILWHWVCGHQRKMGITDWDW